MTILDLVDDKYLMQIFHSLSEMDVDLDGDPLRYGPKRLNGKVAACRRHLNRCQQIYLQVSSDLQKLNRELRIARLDFDLAFQDLMSNDPDVRAGRSVRDREAMANTKLRDDREVISNMEACSNDLEAALQVIRSKRDDLKDVQGRIRDQIKLCQEEINLGGMWGSAPPPDRQSYVPDLEDHPPINSHALEAASSVLGASSTLEVDDLAAFVESETGESGDDFLSGRVVTNNTAPVGKADNALVDAFFDQVDVTPTKVVNTVVSDINIDDLLDSLG
mgnify:FL=1